MAFCNKLKDIEVTLPYFLYSSGFKNMVRTVASCRPRSRLCFAITISNSTTSSFTSSVVTFCSFSAVVSADQCCLLIIHVYKMPHRFITLCKALASWSDKSDKCFLRKTPFRFILYLRQKDILPPLHISSSLPRPGNLFFNISKNVIPEAEPFWLESGQSKQKGGKKAILLGNAVIILASLFPS